MPTASVYVISVGTASRASLARVRMTVTATARAYLWRVRLLSGVQWH